MKRIFIIMLLLAIIATTFGQQTDPPPRLINQHHLKKSKTEKKVGWIMATSGSALLLTSFLIPKGEPFSYNSVTNVGNLFSFYGPPETVYKNAALKKVVAGLVYFLCW